jgi:hypothetical protein
MISLIKSLLVFGLLLNAACSNSSKDKATSGFTNLVVKKRLIDLGRVHGSDDITVNFVLINAGNDNLRLERIEVSCHCTSGVLPMDPVAPGDSVVIPVTYTKKHEGFFYQDVLVHGNFITSPERLSFRGIRKTW